MGLGDALAHMLGKSRAQRVLQFAVLKLGTQLIHGRDPKLLVGAKNAFRVEPRITAEGRKLRRRARP